MAVVIDQAFLMDVGPYRVIECHPGRKSIIFNNFEGGYVVFTAILGRDRVVTRMVKKSFDDLWDWLKEVHRTNSAMGKCFMCGAVRDIQVLYEPQNRCYRVLPIYGGEIYDDANKWGEDGSLIHNG